MLNSKNIERFVLVFGVIIIITTVSGENVTTTEANVSCEKIQSSEFPEDLFTIHQRKCGAIILHIIFALHCFGAIAVVCSDRFLPTINCICQDLKLSDDVAAATFMSIATSAPELFSNIIGTFITESDIGIGHVIGNGYYNMFFVAALGGIVATKEIVLDWWPLARDCAIYTLVALVLTGIVWDGVVQMHETIILLLMYFIYFFIMFNNKKMLRLFFRRFSNDAQLQNTSQSEDVEENNQISEKEREARESGDPEEIESLDSGQDFTLPPQPTTTTTKASENSRWNKTMKILTMPINFLIKYTIPDIRTKKYRNYYPVAFVICVIWIGISTYLGTWMISVIGETIGVPDLVMGMVFMAAGGSVVEAYSVYYKAKRGECSIGLSNSIGCNNLDVTLCLALPWFIKTLPILSSDCEEDSYGVVLESSLIHINCLLLVISVIALFFIFYLNQFKLDKRLGIICGGLYCLVLFIGISIEGYNKS